MAMDDDYRESWISRNRAVITPTVILLVLVGVVVYFLHDTAGMRREAPPLPTLIATLPPPPPPPPKPPEPEKKIEEVQKPVDQPKQPDDAPKPMTINGPAQAGTDAFNIAAGSGGGNIGSGGGFGEANYSNYMSSTIQEAIQNDDRTNTFIGTAEIDVWINEAGRVTRAVLARSSGDSKTDASLVEVLLGMAALKEAPPSTLQFPQRIRIGGKRRG
jgi:periplasmic protein TonB